MYQGSDGVKGVPGGWGGGWGGERNDYRGHPAYRSRAGVKGVPEGSGLTVGVIELTGVSRPGRSISVARHADLAGTFAPYSLTCVYSRGH